MLLNANRWLQNLTAKHNFLTNSNGLFPITAIQKNS